MTTSAEDFAIEGEQDDPNEPQPEELPTTEPPPHKPVQHEAKCLECNRGLRYELTESGNGLIVLHLQGYDGEQSFGLSEDSRPICPNGHGPMTIADEQLLAAEAFALAQEKLNAPAERRLPFPSPRFNPEAANESIFKQRGVVRLKLSIEESKHDAYKKAKKEREEEETVLGALIDKFEQQHDEWIAELERQEERAAAGHPEGTNLVRCKWEEAHPGQVCPICRDDDLKPDAARDSEAHVEEVAALVDVRSAVAVSDALEAFGVLVPVLTIQRWTQDERAAVKAWAEFDRSSTEAAPERPKVLGTSHVAGPGRDNQPQTCTQCDQTLIASTEDGSEPNYFAEGILVGTDCRPAKPEPSHHYPKRAGRRKKAETTEATE